MDDIRGKAAVVLSGAKLRMLDAAGIVVVDKQRLDALEDLRLECQRRVDAVNAIIAAHICDDDEQKKIQRSNEWSASCEINDILEKLEAMQK